MQVLKSFLEKQVGIGMILDCLRDGVIILDKDKKVIFQNDSAFRIIKVDLKDIPLHLLPQKIGLHHLNQTHIVGVEEMSISQALDGIKRTDVRRYVKNENLKTGIYVSIDAIPLKDDNDNLCGAMVNFRDITHKVQKERRNLEERIFFQKLLDLIPGFIVIKNLEGQYTFANQSFRELFPGEEIIGKTAQELFPDVVLDLKDENRAVLSEQKEIWNLFEVRHRDGSRHFYKTIRFPLFDDNEVISGTCIIAFDETQLVEQQKAIEAQRIRSINASKLAELGTLAAEIGHEINNPLGIIKTSIAVLNYMLDNSEPESDIRQQLKIIDQTATRITNIVSALRHVSRDSTNEALSSCTVSEIIGDVRALCGTKLKIKNIQLILEDPKKLSGLSVSCLRIQLSQVLINVLVNASDATQGVKDPWIKIRLDENERDIFLKVTDCGPGVPEEIRDHLFEPFFTTKAIGEGTGLGLSISRDIMHKQGGDIFLDYTDSTNCFVIQIPKKGK